MLETAESEGAKIISLKMLLLQLTMMNGRHVPGKRVKEQDLHQ